MWIKLFLLMIAVNLSAEIGYYQISTASFTTEQLAALRTACRNRIDKYPQSAQRYYEKAIGTVTIITGSDKIEKVDEFKSAIPDKIQVIGYIKITEEGIKNIDEHLRISKYLDDLYAIKKSTECMVIMEEK